MTLGGFHPWLTIEDPEVGMRFRVSGRRLGIIENPLIEEVLSTLMKGITQRKRWVAGFFQSLNSPFKEMGMSRWQRFKAWLNFLPCLSLSVNVIGIPIGVWALWTWLESTSILPLWTVGLAAFNVATLRSDAIGHVLVDMEAVGDCARQCARAWGTCCASIRFSCRCGG